MLHPPRLYKLDGHGGTTIVEVYPVQFRFVGVQILQASKADGNFVRIFEPLVPNLGGLIGLDILQQFPI